MSNGVTQVSALVRLAHPLPTLLNAVVAAALSTVAGARPAQAALAAVTMLGIHTCIGSLNDVFDRHRDAGRTEKPLASGAVPTRAALVIAAVGVSSGLLAASQLGSLALALAAAGATLGLAYNVGVKNSPLSWLPFALGVSIIPLFAWAAAGLSATAPISGLSLAAIPGGAGLALQNGLADRVLDARAGLRGVVVRLGERRALLLALLAHGAAIGVILIVAPAQVAPASLLAASLMIAAGLACSGASTRWTRQRGWELSALGLAVAALSVALATVEGVG
jgi:4-hydroxybenzoate polyprenyltransferase